MRKETNEGMDKDQGMEYQSLQSFDYSAPAASKERPRGDAKLKERVNMG
jgi:hypothetical protein